MAAIRCGRGTGGWIMKPGMSAERLRHARKSAGFSASEFARRIGKPYPTYIAHENGSRNFKIEDARRYAQLLKVSAAWLLTGEGEANSTSYVPIVGYVGAGAMVYPIDDNSLGTGIGEAPAPPQASSKEVALIVRGDSMYPAYRDGDLIYYEHHAASLDEIYGQECVVRLTDGSVMVKTVTRSALPDRITLTSYNAPPREDVEAEWVAPVSWVRRKRTA